MLRPAESMEMFGRVYAFNATFNATFRFPRVTPVVSQRIVAMSIVEKSFKRLNYAFSQSHECSDSCIAYPDPEPEPEIVNPNSLWEKWKAFDKKIGKIFLPKRYHSELIYKTLANQPSMIVWHFFTVEPNLIADISIRIKRGKMSKNDAEDRCKAVINQHLGEVRTVLGTVGIEVEMRAK